MTRTRWILVASSVAASLAALAITGCGGSDTGSPVASGASATQKSGLSTTIGIVMACELGAALTLFAGLLATATLSPEGRT